MVHGVGRGLMDLDPPLCGRRPEVVLNSQLQADPLGLQDQDAVPFERSAKDSCFLQATSVARPLPAVQIQMYWIEGYFG